MTVKAYVLDIETAPMIAAVWGMWKQNVNWDAIQKHWYILCWAAAKLERDGSLGLEEYAALPDYKTAFRKDITDDSKILKPLWKVLDDADVIIAHNGDRFDVPKINARFIENGYPPPSPYRTIDTLKVAKNKFRFTSNRLDALGELLGVGRKIKTDWSLWQRCMAGDVEAFADMVDYNMQDIHLLHAVYMKMRPWIGSRHNFNMFDGDDRTCPTCGSQNLVKRGTYSTAISTFQRYWCEDCCSWSRGRQNTREKEAMKNTIVAL